MGHIWSKYSVRPCTRAGAESPYLGTDLRKNVPDRSVCWHYTGNHHRHPTVLLAHFRTVKLYQSADQFPYPSCPDRSPSQMRGSNSHPPLRHWPVTTPAFLDSPWLHSAVPKSTLLLQREQTIEATPHVHNTGPAFIIPKSTADSIRASTFTQ